MVYRAATVQGVVDASVFKRRFWNSLQKNRWLVVDWLDCRIGRIGCRFRGVLCSPLTILQRLMYVVYKKNAKFEAKYIVNHD